MWNAIPIEVVPFVGALFASLWIARALGKASHRKALAEAQRRVDELRRIAQEASGRAERAEKTAQELKHSLTELPEIAQRLSGVRNARDIPGCALELVQEIFDPAYALFYKSVREELVAVATRGRCDRGVGHRIRVGEGLVGWAASKQLPLTPQEIGFESGMAMSQDLTRGVPEGGFSLCLPVVGGHVTQGVILIGPTRRDLPHPRALGRTIALMTSVAISSAVVLREQEQLAQTDGLTRLLNKTRILQDARDAIAEHASSRRPISLFLFDIDHFKHYNDTNGHLPGDELLQSLGELLRQNLREGESVGRYGGEEFLVLLAGASRDEALQAAERLRALIAQHPFKHREGQPLGCISISGGVASWPEDGADVESLVRCADEALYGAKRAGRNRVERYAPPELFDREEFDLTDSLEPLTDGGKEPPAEA